MFIIDSIRQLPIILYHGKWKLHHAYQCTHLMLNVDRLSSPISFAANCFFLFFGAVLLWSKVILFTSMSQRKEKILHIQLEIDSGHIGSRSERSVTEIWDSVWLSSANYQLRDPTASNDTENCWMNWISKKKVWRRYAEHGPNCFTWSLEAHALECGLQPTKLSPVEGLSISGDGFYLVSWTVLLSIKTF